MSTDRGYEGHTGTHVVRAKKQKENIFLVDVGGRLLRVEILQHSPDFREASLLIEGKVHRVKVVRETGENIYLLVNSSEMTLTKKRRLPRSLSPRTWQGRLFRGDDKAVAAQIPGKVVLVKVKVGDRVKKGDPIMIIESMKMEVTIRVHRDGVVKEVRVKEGDGIFAGNALVILE